MEEEVLDLGLNSPKQKRPRESKKPGSTKPPTKGKIDMSWNKGETPVHAQHAQPTEELGRHIYTHTHMKQGLDKKKVWAIKN